ncbi:MAG: hypothetical protein M3O02_11655 [Acidobacteriota bacterium]|nr:hypothetical protein [Acidobacteriota bacterium]
MNDAAPHRSQSPHLTSQQFGELLDGEAAPSPTLTQARAHLDVCAPCAGEFASLSEALTLFRQTTIACAEDLRAAVEQRSLPLPRPMLLAAMPATLWALAGLLVLAAGLPLQRNSYRAGPPASPASAAAVAGPHAESDEALLDDITRELSASVPAPMRALADPVGRAEAPTQSRPSTLRKN